MNEMAGRHRQALTIYCSALSGYVGGAVVACGDVRRRLRVATGCVTFDRWTATPEAAHTVHVMTSTSPLMIPEVADRLRVSERTVRRMLHDGRLRHLRVGRRLVRVMPDEIDRYIAENTVTLVP